MNKQRVIEIIKRNILPIFLVVVGALLLFSGPLKDAYFEMKLNKEQDAIVSTLSKDKIEENKASLDDSEEMFDFGEIQSIDGFDLPKVDISTLKNAIGIITIPSVNLEQPILHGTTNQNLLLGATTMKSSQKMGEGNYTLAGHNHHTKPVLFQPIRNIKNGDKIYITDKSKVYTYVATSREIVEPSRVDVLDDVPGKKLITLVSCYAKDGSNRIIITGELLEVNDYTEAL